MTTLKTELSSQLQTTLGMPGVWAYAVYFGTDGNPVWSPLVDDGQIQSSGNVSIPLPPTFIGGKVYFLVQSQDASQPHDLQSLITQESDINWDHASDWDFRYDSFEVTLQSGVDDVGNLTSVNGFGLPMEVSVTYSDGTTSTRGYGISATELFDKLGTTSSGQVVFDFTDGPLKDNPREAISPTEAVGEGLPAFQKSDWNAYIASLTVADPGIELAGFFNGAADANGVWHNAGFYYYALEWDATENVFWLSPAKNSEIQGYIKITPGDLANSIYSTLGNVGIYSDKDDAEPYHIFHHAPFPSGDSMNSGENNQWGEVLTQLLTGFTAGFYGTSGEPINPKLSAAIDLNKNSNWDPTYAFGKNLDGSPSVFHDKYSEAFFFNSNSYGSGYSDSLMQHYARGGPLISVSQPGMAKNVDEIRITIFDDGETPAGYETPVIYNYIAPDANGYQQPDSTSTPNSVKLSFANSQTVLSEETAISLDTYMGEGPSGAPIWQTVALTVPEGASRWQIWELTKGANGYTATLKDGTPQGVGQLLITNFPTSGDEGVYWYRLNVGSGEDKKTFNLYAEMSAANGQPSQFLNPNFTGQEGSLAVDGLATISPEVTTTETINTFTVNFLYSGTVATSPDLLVRDPAKSNHGIPSAPVAGTGSGGSFDALSGQSNLAANTISTSQAELAFGWTGLNNSTASTASWISGYTNKIGALNFAQINFSQNGQSLLPTTARADIDGQWQTATQTLGNGTYTVTMKEYLSADTTFKTPVGPQSNPLTLTVSIAETELAASGAGDAVALVLKGSEDPAGNWLSIEPLKSSVSSGTTLLLYATNETGELVSRDGQQIGAHVTLEEATRAAVGSAHDDEGELLLHGAQTVYLQAGLSLRFAVLRGNEIIDADPKVNIVERQDGSLEVSVDGFVLSVDSDNTLSAPELLGETQRSINEALLYLDQGMTLEIDLVGSSANTNTLAFVHQDIDAATGEWSVDGAPYGDTVAFKDAVLANLDEGFLYSNGGQFSDTTYWTVAGETGFYAPVLLTQNGDVFVIGNANAGGNDYIRMYGHNMFGFEDLTHTQGSDFDYNDMVMHLSPVTEANALDAGWLL